MRRQFLQTLLQQWFIHVIVTIERSFKRCLQPTIAHPTLGAVMDVGRSKSDLIAENAFLRHQLVIVRLPVKRLALTSLLLQLLLKPRAACPESLHPQRLTLERQTDHAAYREA